MSSDAVGWTFRRSPYAGATFAVHLAAADSVNDQNDNELWMSAVNLAKKARVSRKTATLALVTIADDGFLTLLEAKIGRPSRYRFEFPDDAPVVFNSRRRPPRPATSGGRSANPQPATSTPAGKPSTCHPDGARPATSGGTNPKEPKEGQEQPKTPAASPPEKVDPVDAMSQRLATLAFEQKPAPVSRGGFPAVRGIIKRLLTAGHAPQAVADVIQAGDIVWTLAGLELKLTQLNRPSTNGSRSAWLDRPGKAPLVDRIAASLNMTPALNQGDDR